MTRPGVSMWNKVFRDELGTVASDNEIVAKHPRDTAPRCGTQREVVEGMQPAKAHSAAAQLPEVPIPVLLIEDDPDIGALLRRWLDKSGFLVTLADDVPRAMELVRDGDFAMVITDVELPSGSGLNVAHVSKKVAPKRPVLLITADNDPDLPILALRHKVDDFLRKPLDRVRVVQTLLEMQRNIEVPEPPSSPRLVARKTVVAIGAHPDDVEIGVGGILAEHAAQGDEIILVAMSPGAQGGHATVRALEAEAAAERLGAELIVGDCSDTDFVESEAIRFLEGVIKEHAPDIVYTHTKNDTHQDHRCVHSATMVAARGVAEVFAYQSPSTTTDFKPTRFVDISERMSEKLTLLAAYGSQDHRPYMQKQAVEAAAQYWGRFADYTSVEPLEVMRSR